MSNAINPLLEDLVESDTMPPVSIELPTRGRWYPLDQEIIRPDADLKNIEVKVLNVLAEINYKDPYLMVSGEALPKMLKHVCPDILKPGELCDIDIEAILLAARIASYGPNLILEHVCHQQVEPLPKQRKKQNNSNDKKPKTCGHSNRITVDLLTFINRYQPLTDDDISDYELSLERLGQKVELRPIAYARGFDVIRQGFVTEDKLKNLKDVEVDALLIEMDKVQLYSEIVDSTSEATVDAITSCIFCVRTRKGDPVFSNEVIKTWLLTIPIDEVDLIRKKINENATKLQKLAELSYICDGCKKENTLSLQMDPQRLFGKGEASKTPTKPSPPSVGTSSKGRAHSKILRR